MTYTYITRNDNNMLKDITIDIPVLVIDRTPVICVDDLLDGQHPKALFVQSYFTIPKGGRVTFNLIYDMSEYEDGSYDLDSGLVAQHKKRMELPAQFHKINVYLNLGDRQTGKLAVFITTLYHDATAKPEAVVFSPENTVEFHLDAALHYIFARKARLFKF